MSDLPRLTRDMIRAWVDKRSYERGEEYHRDGMAFDLRRQGTTLFSRCHGSQEESYRVQATLGTGGIVSDDCSCPVGTRCKHVVALLLAWVESPDEFESVDDILAALEKLNKADLLRLLKEVLAKEPDLYSFVQTSVPTEGKGKGASKVSAAVFRKKADRIFDSMDDEWGASEAVADRLEDLLDAGDDYLEQGDVEAAVAVFQAVCESVLENLEGVEDETGDLHVVVGECVEGLGQCLDAGLENRERRLQVLRLFFDVYERDTEMGGVGLGDGAAEHLDKVEGEERQALIGWLREALDDSSGGWATESYGGWLLDLEGDQLDDEAYLALARRSGLKDAIVERLLERGRLAEAEKEARAASDSDLMGLADVFVEKGQGDLAARLVLERSRTSKDSRLLQWLKKRAAEQGDDKVALELALDLFRQHPSFEGYKEVRELSRKAGTWDTLRGELLEILRKEPHHLSTLVTIHLDEGDLDSALELVRDRKLTPHGYERTHLRVAEAAEKDRPREAREIYRKEAEALIQARGRNNYQAACGYLAKVRDLSAQLGEQEAWALYAAHLRQTHRTLRAFLEEMDNAHL